MDKRAQDKLIRSPGENGGGQDAQKIFTQELKGSRRTGRPRKIWKEEVERDVQEMFKRCSRDVQVMEVRRWRKLVADREKWKDIVRQAKAHSGMQCQMEEKEEEEEEEEKKRIDTIDYPDEEHLVARNMQKTEINKYKKEKNCASSWLFTRSL